MYGESECRYNHNEIEERFHRLTHELKEIEIMGELSVLCGDLNKHIGDLITGNNS